MAYQSNLRPLLHIARLAADATKNEVAPFKWTAEQREAIRRFGLAQGIPEHKVDQDLDRAERDDDLHREFIRTFDMSEFLGDLAAAMHNPDDGLPAEGEEDGELVNE